MRDFWKYLFHLLPLGPIFLGNYWLSLAMAIFVASAYVKVFKLEQFLIDCRNEQVKSDLKRKRDRWLILTFLQKDRKI